MAVSDVIQEHRETVAGADPFWWSAPSDPSPTLYVHGVPTDADDWLPFLSRSGGVAPDLPGMGRSRRPSAFSPSIGEYGGFLEGFVDYLGFEEFALVIHDWGAVGLALAQAHPARITRLVVINTVPLLPGYRWHWGARIARAPILGELATAVTTRPGWRLLLARSQAKPSSIGPDLVQRVAQRYDRETRRTVLDLYRSAPPEALARAGERLHEITAPVLVLWGEADPNIKPSFVQAYAARFADAVLESYPDAGHWPWLDRPELVDRVVDWLSGS